MSQMENSWSRCEKAASFGVDRAGCRNARRLGRESVAVNGDGELAAERSSRPQDMVAMFVRDQDAIELFGRDAALFKAQD